MKETEEFEKFKKKPQKKRRENKPWRHERLHGFRCSHCHAQVTINLEMGTKHRNHCPTCLWSKHVDEAKPGDRASQCGSGMRPIGLTLKIKGTNKYTGETMYEDVMLIHECPCGKYSINRTAADDDTLEIMKIFEQSLQLPQGIRARLTAEGITLSQDREQIERRLLGIQPHPRT